MSENKSYLITGASSGIGMHTCLELLGKNQNVIGIGRREIDQLDPQLVEKECFHYQMGDLSDFEKLPEVIEEAISRHRKIDGVVLSHGFGDFGSLEEFSESRIRKLIDTNLVSYALILRIVLPILKKQGSGVCVIVGSEAAIRGGKRGAVYCASKFGLRGLVQSLRMECSSSRIGISMVNPGMVDTAFFDELDFCPGESADNRIDPAQVAEIVVSILQSPSNTVIDEVNVSPMKSVIQNRNCQQPEN